MWLQRYLPSDPPIYYRLFAELVGCMMFHFIGSVSPTPVANGIALMTIVYFTAKLSGAHLNPAVTTTFMLLGHTNPLETVLYWMAQIAGCALGALWLAALVPTAFIRHEGLNDGCFTPSQNLSDARVFGWEAACTFCFITPVFSVVWYTQQKAGYGNTGPLIVGLSLFASALAAGPYTGAALNPARVLGSPIVFDCRYKKLYTYILGQLTGAIVSTIAIIPCYGIASKPWYRKIFARKMLDAVTAHSNTSIVITTVNPDEQSRIVTENRAGSLLRLRLPEPTQPSSS